MKFVTQLFVLALLALCSSALADKPVLSSEEYEYLYNSYLEQHGKVYESEEYLQRFEIFKASHDKVFHHNTYSEAPYKLAINKFSDWTADELQKLRGFKQSTKRPYAQQALVDILDTSALPESVDWTTHKNVLTPVKNQGQCGSCWSFGTTESIESRYALKYHKEYVLSEQELVSCDNTVYGCDGGDQADAYEYIVQHGQCLETSYPYTSGVTEQNGKCIKSCKAVVFIKGYRMVQPNSEEQLMAAIAEGPLSIAVNAESWSPYSGGIYTASCAGGDDNLDHVVQVVGYGEEDGVKFWKVRNSWGADWGEKGFIRLARGSGYTSDGQCGILDMPAYPLV